MKKEWTVFLTAIMFFTRLPVGNIPYSEKFLNSSSKYLPVIGWIVGGVSALVFAGLNIILPSTIALVFSMVASVLLTGAFHEDGFADTCDGFGGGWTKEKILTIMKDSRIGAYGMIGMFFLLLTKFLTLNSFQADILPFVLIIGHTFSRFCATCFMFSYNYVREDQTSKSKPLGKKIKTGEFIFALITALLPFLLLQSAWVFIIIPFIYLVHVFFARYINKWIGGYTGDCLGAMQQLSEISVYVFLIILIHSNLGIS